MRWRPSAAPTYAGATMPSVLSLYASAIQSSNMMLAGLNTLVNPRSCSLLVPPLKVPHQASELMVGSWAVAAAEYHHASFVGTRVHVS